MAIFDRLFRRQPKAGKRHEQRPQVSTVGPGQARTTPREYGALAKEGYQINVVSFRAINIVAQGVAAIPFKLFSGDKEINEHPLLDLLKRPNPKQSGAAFLRALAGFHQISGNAYPLAVSPRPTEAPKELWPLRPDTIKVVEGADGLPAGYVQEVGSNRAYFEKEQILHWRTFNPVSDWYGMAPLEAAALSVDTHNEGSRWNLALIQNGAKPSGALVQQGEQGLTETQFKRLKSELDVKYQGASNAGRPLLLEGGLRWENMGYSPADMDWAIGKNMTAREIAVAFGVPPQLIGIPDSQTYSNYAEARQSLYEDTVIPLHAELTEELNRWLVPKFDEKLELRPDLDQIPALEAKRQARFERVQDADFMTIDEKRRVAGLEPLPKKLGEQVLVSAAMVPLGYDDRDSEGSEQDAEDAGADAYGGKDD